MKQEKLLSVSVTPDGGVNLTGGAAEDNQAEQLLNLWYDDGALTLRPGLFKALEQEYGRVVCVYPKNGRKLLIKRITCGGKLICERYGVYLATEKAVLSFDGKTVERLPNFAQYGEGGWSFTYADLSLDRCVMTVSGSSEARAAGGDGDWVAQGDGVYLFGGGCFCEIFPLVTSWPYPIGETHEMADTFLTVRAAYTPTILLDAKPDGEGKQGESRNFLSPRVSECFTTDSASATYLLEDYGLDSEEVTADYFNPLTKVETVFSFAPGATTDTQAGITATLDRALGRLTFSQSLTGLESAKSNLRVTYSKTVHSAAPMAQCCVAEWFGSGLAAGDAGNRLFLAGDPDEPNRIYVSGPDNPSYFPDDMTLTAGDPADPITAFGRQYDVLVVLKKSEVFTVRCQSGSGASFTVMPVGGASGCDLPDSVAVAGNTLVWADSRRGVCAMRSTQIRDERAVLCISSDVNPKLLSPGGADLSDAGAVADGRYYYLFAGDAAFVWHYEKDFPLSAGQTHHAFYLWQLPAAVKLPFLMDGRVYAVCENGDAVCMFLTETAADEGGWFEAVWRSKRYDFGLPTSLKRPEGCWLRIKQEGAQLVDVGVGEEEQLLPLDMGDDGAAVTVKLEAGFAPLGSLGITVSRHGGDCGSFGICSFVLHARSGPEIY